MGWNTRFAAPCNFYFWHTSRTINLAGKGTRLICRVPLLFNFHRDCISTEAFPNQRLSPESINTSPAMLACCNWQHIYFRQIDGAGSIPVADGKLLIGNAFSRTLPSAIRLLCYFFFLALWFLRSARCVGFGFRLLDGILGMFLPSLA